MPGSAWKNGERRLGHPGKLPSKGNNGNKDCRNICKTLHLSNCHICILKVMFKLTFKTLEINSLPLFPYNEFVRNKFCYLGSFFFRVFTQSTLCTFGVFLICSCNCTKFLCFLRQREKRAAHVPLKWWYRQIEFEFWLNGFLGVLTKIAEKWAKTCNPIEHMQIEIESKFWTQKPAVCGPNSNWNRSA